MTENKKQNDLEKETLREREARVLNLITGTSGDDNLVGTSGDDQIKGLDGNDIIEGKEGADVIYGGDGVDTVSYRSSSVGVQINASCFTDSGCVSTGDASGDKLRNIEIIELSDNDNEVKLSEDEFRVNTYTAGNQASSAITS